MKIIRKVYEELPDYCRPEKRASFTAWLQYNTEMDEWNQVNQGKALREQLIKIMGGAWDRDGATTAAKKRGASNGPINMARPKKMKDCGSEENWSQECSLHLLSSKI